MWLIKFLLKRYLKKHPEWLISSIGIDEKTDITILVSHYYDNYWTYGMRKYDYSKQEGEV